MNYFILVLYYLIQLIFASNNGKICDGYQNSILKRFKKDVFIEENGAMIATARINTFVELSTGASPLRNSFYYRIPPSNNIGHIRANEIGDNVIVELFQSYQINRIRFWFWDLDSRIHTFQVFVSNRDDSNETMIFDGKGSSILTLKFPTQKVSKIRFYNKGGNDVNKHMAFVKIQAFHTI